MPCLELVEPRREPLGAAGHRAIGLLALWHAVLRLEVRPPAHCRASAHFFSEISRSMLARELGEALRVPPTGPSSSTVPPRGCQAPPPQSPPIRRLFIAGGRHPMCSIFISNNFRIEMFAPSQKHDSSARTVSRSLKMEELFCSFVLDIECKARIMQLSEIELKKGIRKSATVDHMTIFGRPL